jgi:hypothetical protein
MSDDGSVGNRMVGRAARVKRHNTVNKSTVARPRDDFTERSVNEMISECGTLSRICKLLSARVLECRIWGTSSSKTAAPVSWFWFRLFSRRGGEPVLVRPPVALHTADGFHRPSRWLCRRSDRDFSEAEGQCRRLFRCSSGPHGRLVGRP